MSERATGRIVTVWTEEVATTLTEDATAGATVLYVDDCSVFNDDDEAGSLRIGSQVVSYTEVDDDAGTVTLAAPLDDDADEDDTVAAWSDLYGEVDTRQYAMVDPDGRDRGDFIQAEVGDGLDLADGDRGKRGESCTIVRERRTDEWLIEGVLGRPAASRGRRWEIDDSYELTSTAIADGEFRFQLTHVPVEESVQAVWEGITQPPTDYSVDDNGLVIWPLDGHESEGDLFWFHYQWLKGVTAPDAPTPAGTPTWLGVAQAKGALVAMVMDETSGTTIDDDSGNDHDGTLSASAATLGAAAIAPGFARSIDLGPLGYIEIPYDTWLGATSTTGITAELLFQLDALPGTGSTDRGTLISSRAETNASSSFQVQVRQNRIEAFYFYNTGGEFRILHDDLVLSVGDTIHMVVVLKAAAVGGSGINAIWLYINGEYAGSVTGGTNGPIARTRPIRIGNDERSDRNGADMKVCAYAFYDSRLVESDAAELYAATQTPLEA